MSKKFSVNGTFKDSVNTVKFLTERNQFIKSADAVIPTPTDELNVIHYFTMLHSYIIDGAVIPRGRSHQISTALLEAFTENGGEAWFNTSVKKIIVKNGVATGVELDDGTIINA